MATKTKKTTAAKKSTAAKKTTPKKKVSAEKKKTTKAVVKKTTKSKKPTTKKATPKKTPEVNKPRVKKDGLRKPQIRILQALKSGKELTRAQVAEKANVSPVDCTYYIGANDADLRALNDKKHYPSLIGLKLVKIEQHDIDDKDVILYTITALGKKRVV